VVTYEAGSVSRRAAGLRHPVAGGHPAAGCGPVRWPAVPPGQAPPAGSRGLRLV